MNFQKWELFSGSAGRVWDLVPGEPEKSDPTLSVIEKQLRSRLR